MTHVYLIRHGENDHVKEKRLAGRIPDVHLNARGQQQAEAIAQVLKDIRLDAIASSPLERAMETSLPLSRVHGVPVHVEPRLLEMDYGTWQGKTLKSLQRRKLWPLVNHQPSRIRFPDGESFLQAQTRAVAAIESLRAAFPQPGASVACVSHADVIKLITAYYLGLSLDLFQRLQVAPASITIFSLLPDQVHLVTINDQRASQITPAL
ncbi:MAG: MSMEG_4193 family putative phosphomutase [Anaerolineales bacterium]|nr:MSMEG_4193 family putative phosphomutase [Anaerolineales bacterium]